ncbi:hypothetical protein LZ660_23940, partial [Enterobacter hormaechei]|uniref:hypothetical protein n=1 Tax=Enterobacter hormaechei TaxID=158836 RepID=UPI001F34372E
RYKMKKTALLIFIIINIISVLHLLSEGSLYVTDFQGVLSSLILAFSAAYFPIIVFISIDDHEQKKA